MTRGIAWGMGLGRDMHLECRAWFLQGVCHGLGASRIGFIPHRVTHTTTGSSPILEGERAPADTTGRCQGLAHKMQLTLGWSQCVAHPFLLFL